MNRSSNLPLPIGTAKQQMKLGGPPADELRYWPVGAGMPDGQIDPPAQFGG